MYKPEHSPEELTEFTALLNQKDEEKTPALLTAAQYPKEQRCWLWWPYIPLDDLTILMASGGTGKSIFTCGLAAAITTGAPILDETFRKEPRNVLFISAEDSGSDYADRLTKCGADLNRVFILDRDSSVGLDFGESTDRLESYIKECSPALVTVDPWHGFCGTSTNIDKINQLRPVLQRLARVAKLNHCAILLISHINKRSQGENANFAAMGSADLVNAARSALRIIFDDNNPDQRIIVHTKSNFSEYGKSVVFEIDDGGVVWKGYSDINRETLERAARSRCKPGELLDTDTVNEALVSAVEGAANCFALTKVSYDELAKMHGEGIYGGRQAKRALDAVRARVEADGFTISTGIQFKKNGRKTRGFSIIKTEGGEQEHLGVPIS